MAVLCLAGAAPLILSFWPPLRLYCNLKALAASISLTMLIFGAWDVFATWRTHWYFNPDSVYNVRIFNLPLEEALFFVVIPFCCIFTWEALKYIKEELR
jgi:lycopene cyclase domain-containing protein